MPIQVTRYLCHFCLAEYNDYSEASQCESLGPPIEEGIEEGDSITFQNENGSDESRWSYESASGPVLLKAVTLNRHPEYSNHSYKYVVKLMHCEAIVGQAIDESGTTSLFSPAENKYRPGFAEQWRQSILENKAIR
jgi:hypothetical protein